MTTMKKYIILTAALLTVGCQSSSEQVNSLEGQIRVEAILPPSTRATATEFEAGDTMGLYAVEYTESGSVPALQISGNYINNEPLTFDGTQWNSARPLYYSDKACDFYAVYPYQNPKSINTQLFDIVTDQASEPTDGSMGGYEASDLLWAKTEAVSYAEGATVPLRFKHLMSRVVVKLERGPKYEGELPDDIVVHLYNTVTTAEVDYANGSLQSYGMGEKNTITMKPLAKDEYVAIVVPQHVERKTPLIEITMEGIAYLLNYSMSFRPGYQQTITVTLNTSPDQEKIEISIDGDISDWN